MQSRKLGGLLATLKKPRYRSISSSQSRYFLPFNFILAQTILTIQKHAAGIDCFDFDSL
jgi:hypothetical protein